MAVYVIAKLEPKNAAFVGLVDFSQVLSDVGVLGNVVTFGADVLADSGVAISGLQTADATLTSIAALGTAADKMLYTIGVDTWAEASITTAGRALLDDANATAQIATLGLDADIATLSLPASTTISTYAKSFLDDTSEAIFKATVNLEIGVDVQAYDATLTSIALLGTAADKMLYSTGVDTWAEASITAAGRALLDDANAAAQIATLGLDADIATLSLPASTTISVFGASIVDDANAAAVLATLGLDADLATFSLPASTTISTFGASIIDDLTEAAFKATVNLEIGTDVQAYNSNLTAINQALTTTGTPQFSRLGLGVAADASYSLYTSAGIRMGGTIQETAAGFRFVANSYYDVGWKYRADGYAQRLFFSNVTGDITFETAPTGLAGNATSFVEWLAIPNAGGVILNETGADVDFRVESDTNANALFLEGSSGNIGFGTATFGTSLTNGIGLKSGVAPTTSPADTSQIWSADYHSIAGQTSLHCRRENGDNGRIAHTEDTSNFVKAILIDRVRELVTPANIRGMWLFDVYSSETSIQDRGDLNNDLSITDTAHSGVAASTATPLIAGVAPTLTSTSSIVFGAADDDDFSFGDGSNDTAFSIVICYAPSDVTFAYMTARWDITTGVEQREYRLYLDGSSILTFQAFDSSAGATIGRKYNSSIAADLNGWHTYVGTKGTGTTAAALKIYRDGVQIDDTDSNSGSGYVAMENMTGRFGNYIISAAGAVANVAAGRWAFCLLIAEELSATVIAKLHRLLMGYTGNSLG